jgi:hypothetical protein
MMRYGSSVRLALFAVVAPLVVACTDRQPVTGAGPLPVQPTAYPSPTGGLRVANPSEDIHELVVDVEGGAFNADRYSVQSTSVRLMVTAEDAPYTFSIDRLAGPQVLAPGTTAVIGLTVPEPGDYTMRISGQREDTAVLSVRPPGGR